jgi:hypothetical protein
MPYIKFHPDRPCGSGRDGILSVFQKFQMVENPSWQILWVLEENVFFLRRGTCAQNFKTLGQGWATGSLWDLVMFKGYGLG